MAVFVPKALDGAKTDYMEAVKAGTQAEGDVHSKQSQLTLKKYKSAHARRVLIQ